MASDPDKDKEEKTPAANNLFESLSSKRTRLWNDFTSKIKSDKSTPDTTSEADAPPQISPSKAGSNSSSFMESVKQKLQGVRLHENGRKASENERPRGEPECAPLIDTADNSTAGSSCGSDAAICGESDTIEQAGSLADDHTPSAGACSETATRRKKLGKRADSFTAEEVYLDTVASQVRSGLVQPESETTLVSPSKAVQEFVFAESNAKEKPQVVSKGSSSKNRLAVANGNLINFDSVQNLSQAASSKAETVVHREDDGVFDYESSGWVNTSLT